MAKCAKCGTQKLSERPCPKCGWGDPEVTNQTEQIVTRAEAERVVAGEQDVATEHLARSYLKAMEALAGMMKHTSVCDQVHYSSRHYGYRSGCKYEREARALLTEYEGGTE